MPITNPDDIRLQNKDELEALIGNPPGWTLRWGMTILFTGCTLLLALAWFVQYPDVITAPTVLTTERPPIRLAAGASAKIAALYVKNGQTVQAGALIAELENPARTKDINRLEAMILQLTKEDADVEEVDLPKNLRLGPLQEGFARLERSLKDWQFYTSNNLHFQKIKNLRRQLADVNHLNESIGRQGVIMEEEVALAYKNVVRDSILLTKNSISQLEYEQSRGQWLRMRRGLEELRSTSAQNDLKIHQFKAQLIDLQQIYSNDENERYLLFKSEVDRLKGEIDQWKQSWLLVAPIGGEVALTNAWSEKQFVEAGQEVLTIVPVDSSGAVIAKAFLAGKGSGKVKNGMPAQLRLDGFPYQEFGVLEGNIARIAKAPGKTGYEVEIQLHQGMVTSHGKPVPFLQEMTASTRIVTDKRSLLGRILEKITAAMQE
jgi:HlyD family secretion protein